MRVWLLLAVLALFLVGAIAYSVVVWVDLGEVAIGWRGWLALSGGVVLTLALGGGLMALVFYSSRHGHDDIQADRRAFEPEDRARDD